MSATLAQAARNLPAEMKKRAQDLGLLPQDTPEGAVQAVEERVETLRSGRLQEPVKEETPSEPEPKSDVSLYRGKDGNLYVKGGGRFGFAKDDKKFMMTSVASIEKYLGAGWTVHIVRDGEVVSTRTP